LTPSGNNFNDFPENQSYIIILDCIFCSWTAQNWLDCTVRICPGSSSRGWTF